MGTKGKFPRAPCPMCPPDYRRSLSKMYFKEIKTLQHAIPYLITSNVTLVLHMLQTENCGQRLFLQSLKLSKIKSDAFFRA